MLSAQRMSPKQKLYDLLDQITDPNIKQLETEYAANKQAFFDKFENPGGTKPISGDIFLYEQWLRYHWTRTALSFLGFQKQQLAKRVEYNNTIARIIQEERAAELLKKQAVYQTYFEKERQTKSELELKSTFGTPLTDAEKFILKRAYLEPVYFDYTNRQSSSDAELYTPAIPDTVAAVIQQDKINRVSIADSIATMRKICMQIVGTEHPTDPYSQEAHDILSLMANEFLTDKPSDDKLIELLGQLRQVDSIPHVRREVQEEVSRDKKITAHRFYDNIPVFRKAVFAAYKKYYGAELTPEYSKTIWLALEGGLQPDNKVISPIINDVSWAAGDAEGNPNVDPPATGVAVTNNRREAAKKHAETIQSIIELAKLEERRLRDKIPAMHNAKFDLLLQLTTDLDLIRSFQRFQTDVSKLLIHRNFKGLVGFYKTSLTKLQQDIQKVIPNASLSQSHLIMSIYEIYQEQASFAEQLHLLTLFSGSYLPDNVAAEAVIEGKQLAEGALSRFKEIFNQINLKVGDDKHSNFIKQNNLDSLLEQFNAILQEHAQILELFPEMKEQLLDFRLQFKAFGMGLGYMHIRQDSLVLMDVWHVLLADVGLATNFKSMHPDNQAGLLTKLLDESEESQSILKRIYDLGKGQHYVNNKLVRDELERMELALDNPDIFEVWIMSNTRTLANILTLLAFKKIFPYPNNQLHIVPLLENLVDLQNSPKLLEGYIQTLIIEDMRKSPHLKLLIPMLQQQPKKMFLNTIHPYQDHLVNRVEVMFGYSDSERGSGMSALIEVDRMQEVFRDLADEYGINYRVFDGAGGDLFRGGPMLGSRKQKVTRQGSDRDNAYGTPMTAAQLRETQFANSYLDATVGKLTYKSLPPYVLARLDSFCQMSSAYFENFLDTKKGFGAIVGLTFGWGPKFLVELANQSSRGNVRALDQKQLDSIEKNHSDLSRDVQRGGKDNVGFVDPSPLRAIAASQLYEDLRLYMHIIVGPGHAMRALDTNPESCRAMVKSLYFLCPAFQDIYEKMLYGLAAVKLDVAIEAYFGHDKKRYRPANEEQRLAWIKEAKTFGGKYTKDVVKKQLESDDGKQDLLVALSRLFVLIEDEFTKTREFMAATNKLIYAEKYRYHDLKEVTKNTDLLYHDPELVTHLDDVYETVEPLNWLLARMCNYLARNEKLDWVFNVTKETKLEGSKLSIIGLMLGHIVCGINVARIPLLNFDVQRPRNKLFGQHHIQQKVSARDQIKSWSAKNGANASQKLFQPAELDNSVKKADVVRYDDNQRQHSWRRS